MAEIFKPHDSIVYLSWIDAIRRERLTPLTEWEGTFLTSLEMQLKYRNLSRRQAEILDKLYADKTS